MPHTKELTGHDEIEFEKLDSEIRGRLSAMKPRLDELAALAVRMRESRLYLAKYQTYDEYALATFGRTAKAMEALVYRERKKAKQIAPSKRPTETREVSTTNCEYVGTENVREDKPMATARKIPGADHGHTTPPPPPTASTVRPSVSPALFNEIHAIVNYIKRVESKEPSLSDSPGFRHIITLIQNLESRVQILLPGMETVCASEGKPKSRATLEQLREYCLSLNLPADDGDWFHDKMLQSGWKVDGKPVNDVYATIRNWNRMKIMCSQKQTPYATKTNALTGKNSNGRNSIPDYSKGF